MPSSIPPNFGWRLSKSGPYAGNAIQALAASVKTQDRAIIVAGFTNGSSQVLHVTLSNRYVHKFGADRSATLAWTYAAA